jgi:hypothetical protein
MGGALKQKTWDFSWLMTVPEARLKRSNFFFKASTYFTIGVPIRRWSSTTEDEIEPLPHEGWLSP